MEGFKSSVKFCTRELTGKEKVSIKDTTIPTRIDNLLKTVDDYLDIAIDYFAVLDVHNERTENKDYEIYVIVDKDGNRYMTGSPSFYSALADIYEEMKEVDEDWGIRVYRRDSKTYSGKTFITCSVI